MMNFGVGDEKSCWSGNKKLLINLHMPNLGYGSPDLKVACPTQSHSKMQFFSFNVTGSSCWCGLHHPASREQKRLFWPAELHNWWTWSTFCGKLQGGLQHYVHMMFVNLKVFAKIVQHFMHKTSVTSVHAEANSHCTDWLMNIFCEWNSPMRVCSQQVQCVK